MNFVCKQNAEYELRISDWSSDVGSSDLAPFGRVRWLVLQEARHDVDLLGGQLPRGAPVGHAGRRAEVDQRLEVVGALGTGDVRGQRLAGGALAQHAMAAGAALEEDLGDRKSTRLNSSH